jgi:hypothetical protein
MRSSASLILGAALLAGCSGYAVDHWKPRAEIVAPELPRFGYDARQAQCVADRLGGELTPRQLGLFARRAGALQEGFFVPGQLTPRDLMHLATHFDPEVALSLSRANEACGVTGGIASQAGPRPAPEAPRPPQPGEPVLPEPAQDGGPAAPTASAWLNLGAAPSGQGISVDASSLQQEGRIRTAWFRLSMPGQAPTGISYRLRIDCEGRTITPLANRRAEATEDSPELYEYGEGERNALPIEGGTVMEIAFLALCT